MFRLGIWDQWTARRAAVSQIAPLIGHTERRHGPISETAWHDPYVIGFLTTFITLIALARTRGRLAGEQLGLVQLAAWHELTRIKDDRVGEDILLLSANSDAGFIEGCLNARRFLAAMNGEASLAELDINWEELPETGHDCRPEDLDENLRLGVPMRNLWEILFETHLPGASSHSTNFA